LGGERSEKKKQRRPLIYGERFLKKGFRYRVKRK